MTPEQAKQVLSSSNKRLVIMGRFNSTDAETSAAKGKTFRGSSGVDSPKLSVADFFEQVQPELRYVRDKTVRVGNTAFNSFKLRVPREGGKAGHGQLITADSPLLNERSQGDSKTPATQWQESGAKLFQGLLKDLDEVAKFADGKFSSALLKLSRRYMVDYADRQSSDDKIDRSDWQTLAYDHACSSAILSYMTCCRGDEGNAKSEVSKALDTHAQDADHPLTVERVNLLLDGLAQCKRACEAGRQDDDILLGFGKEREFAYLQDFPGSSKYGLSIEGAGGKSFAEHYRYFLERSNAVHRFVRNGSLHSYLFLWLAGKHEGFENKDQLAANTARKMYETGVEGQGDKRIPGETAEERKRNFELVRDTESTVSAETKAQIQSDIYDRMQDALLEGILEKLRPERTFRRDALNRRNRSLFVFLGQMAGGKAGQILGQATDKAAALARIYRAAKNVRAKEGEVLVKEQFDKAFDKLRTEDMAPFVDALKEEVAALQVDGAGLSDAVCTSVVRRIAAETKTYFDETWVGDLDGINEEVAALGSIYDLRNKVDVERRAEGSRGMPMTVLTSKEISILAPVEASESDSRAYAKSLERAATAAGVNTRSGPVSAQLVVPASLEDSVKSNEHGVLKNKAGQEIATLASQPDKGLITATLNPEVHAGELMGEDVRVDFGSALSGVKLREVEGLDMQPLVRSGEEQVRQLESVTTQFDSYSKTQSLLRKKYVEDRSAKGDTNFTRAARALALGEYMAAAPPKESNLGVADLSNVLGVVLDMVEHVGEVDEAKMFLVGDKLPEDVLGRINLSQQFPVNNAAELGTILQYHFDQCEALGELDEYFAELRHLRNLFGALEGTDAEVTVYNCTLAEHCDEDFVAFSRDLCVVREHPIALYLTEQASPSVSSLTSFSRRVAEELRSRAEDTASLQLPLVVTPAALAAGGIFPVVSGSTVELPSFAPLGTALAGTLSCSAPDMSPYLALATSLVLGAGSELGQLGDLTPRQRRNLNEVVKVTAQPEQSLASLLSSAWLELNSPIMPLLCMAKWVNICLLHDPQTTEVLQSLLTSSCLDALKPASDANSANYLAPHAFDGLGGRDASEWIQYMPSVFSGTSSEPMSSRGQKIAFNSGALGVKQKAGARNFGQVSFVGSLASSLTGGGVEDAEQAPAS